MIALVLQSFVFAALHLFNTGTEITTLLPGMLVRALWTCLYVRYRNLWIAGFNHAAWNFAIFLSGAPLSGTQDSRALALFASTDHGPAWLTGGALVRKLRSLR